MILVTGAAGKTGQAIIRTLAAKGKAVRALVRRPEQVEIVRRLGAAEAHVGDLLQPNTMDRAAKGMAGVYHICPNVHPEELAIGRAALDAAAGAGVQRFVYHSVLHPQVEAMPHHWLKLRVEEILFESGLPFTILQPAAYMQNTLAQWDAVVQTGLYAVPYRTSTSLGMVDLEDVAEAAANVLSQPGHEGATYELAGPDVLTQDGIAAVLEKNIRRPVRATVVALNEWESNARTTGLGDYQIDTLLSMFEYYDKYGLWGSPRVLEWLLGRPATSFAEFVRTSASKRLDTG